MWDFEVSGIVDWEIRQVQNEKAWYHEIFIRSDKIVKEKVFKSHF